MSRPAFATRFAELLGEPPLQYVTRCRIDKAIALLQQDGPSTAEVATLVGCESEAEQRRRGATVVGICGGYQMPESSSDGIVAPLLFLADYAPEASVVDEIRGGGLVVVRSLTKFYGIPAARIGDAVASSDLAVRLEEQVPSWPSGRLDVVAAVAALESLDDQATGCQNRIDRELLAAKLEDIGLERDRPCPARRVDSSAGRGGTASTPTSGFSGFRRDPC